VRKLTAITTVVVALTLLGSATRFTFAEASSAVSAPQVVITDVLTNSFSGYKITVNTTDGGKIVYLFIWQRGINWTLRGMTGRFIFDTPPMLQMTKYFANETLDFSITYTPLYLLQYKDMNVDGLFNLWTRGHHESDEEIDDVDIEWDDLIDKPLRIYCLAPAFNLVENRSPLRWDVSPLTSRNITVTLPNGSAYETYEYLWNVSASVPSIPWHHDSEHEFLGLRYLAQPTTVNIYFSYHIQLLPENPVVKYDFNLSGITWVSGTNVKLAMISSIQYYSKETPVVQLGAKPFHGFDEDEEVSAPTFTISENATDRVKAFVSYNPYATVDGVNQTNVVKTALHPLFLIPTPVPIPEGVCVRGTYPGMEGERTWRHYIAFAHQLGLPHFNNSVSQDPVIGLVATLATVSLILPQDLLALRPLIAVTIIATVLFTTYYLAKRRIRTIVATPQRA